VSSISPNQGPAFERWVPQTCLTQDAGGEGDNNAGLTFYPTKTIIASVGKKIEKFKKYYDSLLASYHAITLQLQCKDSLSPPLVAQLQEKHNEIKQKDI
jgi:hypothetical protein